MVSVASVLWSVFCPLDNFPNPVYHYSFILPGGQAHKRRRTSEPIEIEDRLESLICRVGEKVKAAFANQRFHKCTLQALNAGVFSAEHIFT